MLNTEIKNYVYIIRDRVIQFTVCSIHEPSSAALTQHRQLSTLEGGILVLFHRLWNQTVIRFWPRMKLWWSIILFVFIESPRDFTWLEPTKKYYGKIFVTFEMKIYAKQFFFNFVTTLTIFKSNNTENLVCRAVMQVRIQSNCDNLTWSI